METILNAVNEYTQLAIKCSHEQHEKIVILLNAQKACAYNKIMIAISGYAEKVKFNTWQESINLIQGEQAND